MFLQGTQETLQSFWGKCLSKHTRTHTQKHERMHTHTITHTPYSKPHTHKHTHTHTHTLTHMRTCARAHTIKHARTHTCTHATHTHQSRSRVSHLKLQIITSQTAEYHISENSNLDVCHHETLKPHSSKLVMSLYLETVVFFRLYNFTTVVAWSILLHSRTIYTSTPALTCTSLHSGHWPLEHPLRVPQPQPSCGQGHATQRYFPNITEHFPAAGT